MKVKVYEDNSGGIHAIVIDHGIVTNIISGFENGTISCNEFIQAAQNGFCYADEYDSSKYSNRCIKFVATEIEAYDDLIAVITLKSIELFEEKMGTAGRELFDID